MKNAFFTFLLILIFSCFYTSCNLFPKDTPDETDGLSLMTFEELTKEIEQQSAWTLAEWTVSISQIEKTKRSTNKISIDNYAVFGDNGLDFIYFYYSFILPTVEALKEESLKKGYQNPLNTEEEDKQQYVETLESYEIHVNDDKSTFIFDIFTSRFDKKNNLVTEIVNRYKLIKK